MVVHLADEGSDVLYDVDHMAAQRHVGGFNGGVQPAGLDDRDVLNVVLQGGLPQHGAHAGRRLDRRDGSAGERQGQGQPAAARAHVQQGLTRQQTRAERLNRPVVRAVGVGLELRGKLGPGIGGPHSAHPVRLRMLHPHHFAPGFDCAHNVLRR